MAIILEGPDAAGKSTLADCLVRQFGMEHLQSGGAPGTYQEVLRYCEMQLNACNNRNIVIDRVTPISHPIYNPFYRNHVVVMDFLTAMINHKDTVAVYCRPPTEALMRPEKHVWKDYDTEEHKQKVLRNQHDFILQYDKVFQQIPHITYDYTDFEMSAELIAMFAASVDSDEILAKLKELQKRVTR